jgi:hypothetical protein
VALSAPAGLAASPLAVQLDVTGPPEERAALEASLRELCSRLEVVLVPPGPEAALARVAVALDPSGPVVTILDRQGTVVTSRRLPRGPSASVTIEAVATVVHATVAELAEQERHPAARRVVLPGEPLLGPPSDAAAPSAEAPPWLEAGELGALLTGRAFGDTAPVVFGGGLWGAVRARPAGAWTPRFTLLATWSGPFTAEATQVQLTVQTVSLRLLGGVRYGFTPVVALEGSLGLGLDLAVAEGRAPSLAPAAIERLRVHASPILGALVAVRFQVSGATSLLVAVGLDLDLLPRRYVTDLGGARGLLFDTWRFRPGLMAGFTFDLGRTS